MTWSVAGLSSKSQVQVEYTQATDMGTVTPVQ